MARGLSRPKRWAKACSDGLGAVGSALEHLGNLDAENVGELEEADAKKEREQLAQRISEANDQLDELRELQGEYQEWYDNLPENLQDNSPVAEKLQEITGLDVPEWLSEDIGDTDIDNADTELTALEDFFNEAEGVDLPRGFGRD